MNTGSSNWKRTGMEREEVRRRSHKGSILYHSKNMENMREAEVGKAIGLLAALAPAFCYWSYSVCHFHRLLAPHCQKKPRYVSRYLAAMGLKGKAIYLFSMGWQLHRPETGHLYRKKTITTPFESDNRPVTFRVFRFILIVRWLGSHS